MRDRKGFSLIELLGALVIIGLILLVVVPSVSRLLTSNDTKQYNNYLKIIESGAKVYADKRIDDLGSDKDTGCIEVTLDELIKEDYLKKYEDKDVTCSGKVRINNNKGKVKVSTNVTCVDKDNKETFKKEEISDASCLAFIPKEEGGLARTITKYGMGSDGYISVIDAKNYIKGSNPKNYVWYSGKLWRVVYYTDDVVKLVSNDIITVMNKSNISYKDSNISEFLNNIFLPTLKDYNNYLIDTSWDISITGDASYLPNNTSVVTGKIGLLNSYEAYNMGDFIDYNYKWLLSNYYGNNIRLAISGGSVTQNTYSSSDYYAIRPAITMDAKTFVLTGNGSKSLPYILEGNSTNISKGTLLNTRLSGEYLKINDELYRIVKTTNNLTKVIMVDTLSVRQYDSVSHNFSYSDLYSYLKNDWYENNLGQDKKLVFENGSWCSNIINGNISFNNNCMGDAFTSPVGIPSLGDIHTSNNEGQTNTFWTIDAYSAEGDIKINAISGDTKNNLLITDNASVKPVMYLKENVIIKEGNGTSDNPFVLDLK